MQNRAMQAAPIKLPLCFCKLFVIAYIIRRFDYFYGQ